MAKERVFTYRNVGTENAPVWEVWFQKTVADAVLMSDADGETKTIVDYVNQKIADLIGSAPETYDTLQEIAEYIASHESVATALNSAIGSKVDKVEGKGLSSNDYTNEAKAKVDNLDTVLNGKVPTSRKVNGKALSADITLTAADVGAVAATAKGAAGGVAELDSAGKVPAAQLPSYVDDVIEGYLSGGKFYKEAAHTTEITGETGKIYVDLATNKTYRWSGTTFVVISDTIALGETASTAYRGDRGKAAYDHSQTAHAPANAQKNVQSDWNETNTASDTFIKNKPSSLPANGGNASTVNGHTVEANVPSNAKFTDTVYTHPTNHPASMITEDASHRFATDAEKAAWNAKANVYFASSLPASAPAGAVCFLIA